MADSTDTKISNSDSNQFPQVTLGTALSKDVDTITSHPKAPTPVNLTASGSILATPGQIVGFYVASTSSGTIVLRDGGSDGTAISGTITPAVGYHAFPAALSAAGYATLGNTIDVTFFVIPA